MSLTTFLCSLCPSSSGAWDDCWWTSFTAYPWINHVCLKPGHQRKARKTVLKSSVFNYLSFYSSLSSICFPWNVPETFPSQRFCMDQAFYKKHAPARNPHGSVPLCLQVFTLMSCSRAYSDHPPYFFFLNVFFIIPKQSIMPSITKAQILDVYISVFII